MPIPEGPFGREARLAEALQEGDVSHLTARDVVQGSRALVADAIAKKTGRARGRAIRTLLNLASRYPAEAYGLVIDMVRLVPNLRDQLIRAMRRRKEDTLKALLARLKVERVFESIEAGPVPPSHRLLAYDSFNPLEPAEERRQHNEEKERQKNALPLPNEEDVVWWEDPD